MYTERIQHRIGHANPIGHVRVVVNGEYHKVVRAVAALRKDQERAERAVLDEQSGQYYPVRDVETGDVILFLE